MQRTPPDRPYPARRRSALQDPHSQHESTGHRRNTWSHFLRRASWIASLKFVIARGPRRGRAATGPVPAPVPGGRWPMPGGPSSGAKSSGDRMGAE